MIRFIDLGTQIGPYDDDDPENTWPRQFAFIDTIYDRFVDLDGEQVWDRWSDFEASWKAEAEGCPAWAKEYSLERFGGVSPQWAIDAAPA